MRVMFDDIQFKVLGSHIKIPMIFLVPVMFLGSLYVMIYFFANSVMALEQTEQFLHEVLGGQIKVKELVVQPNLTRVHLYSAKLLDQEKQQVVSVEQVHAAINPTMLLEKRIDVYEARVVGADVMMRIDDSGQLNLLRALGITSSKKEEKKPDDGGSSMPEIRISNVNIERSKYTFILDGIFRMTIPQVNIPGGEINLAPNDLQMFVQKWHVPRADFRFEHKLFGFPKQKGDWTYSIYDFGVEDWRWIRDGFTAKSVVGNVEGYEVKMSGQMGFPADERGMTYKAKANLKIPYWSPFIQYFVEDNVHFDVPQIDIEGEGTLQWVESKAKLFARKVHVAGLTAENLEASLALHNQLVVLDQAKADFNGGKVNVNYAFFDLFQTAYGVEADFKNVNPARALKQLGADLPFIDGKASGSVTATGKVPSTREFRPGQPGILVEHTTDRWIDLTVTKDLVLERSNQLLAPGRRVRMLKGSRVWVDLDRVVIPKARFRVGADEVRMSSFALNYLDMNLEPLLDPRGAVVQANLVDAEPYLKYYGLEGISSGPVRGVMTAIGPLLAPKATLDVSVEEPSWGERVKGTRARLRARLNEGVLSLDEVLLKTSMGWASASGKIDMFKAAPMPELPTMLMYQPRRKMKTNVNARLENINLKILKPFLPKSLPVAGLVDGRVTATGDLNRLLVCADATALQGNVMGQPIERVDLKVAMRDPYVRRACFGQPMLDTPRNKRHVDVQTLDISFAQAGRLRAKGIVGFDQSFDLAIRGDDLDLAKLDILKRLPVPIEAKGDLRVHGKGTFEQPKLGGSLRLKDARVMGLDVGDLAMVVNTTEVEEKDPFTNKTEVERTIHVVGAVLPWLNVAVELPLDPTAPIYAKVGFDDLNLIRMMSRTGVTKKFAVFEDLKTLKQLRLTGDVQFYYYRDQQYPGYSLIANLPDVNIGPKRFQLSNQKTISVGYTRQDGPDGPLTDRVTIEHFSLGSDDKYITVAGSVTPQDTFLDLEIDGQLDLGLAHTLAKLVPNLVPEEIVDVNGAVKIDATLSGEPSTLVADGRVDILPSTVQLRSLSDPLALRSGTVIFERDRISIDRSSGLRGEILGGSFSIWGDMGLDQFKPSSANLNVWSHNMSYSVPEVASVTFDTNVNFKAKNVLDMKTWTIGGQVEFLDGLFYQDISVFEKELTGRVMGAFNRRTEVFEASVLDQFPELKQVGLNLTVKARDGFKLKNQIERFTLDLEFRFQLLLSNTLNDLRLAGDIEVVDGAIIFQGKKFAVRTGLVRFEGPPDNPFIDVVAGADIRNVCKESVQAQELTPPIALTSNTNDDAQDTYHISLNVRGRPDQLNILYESIPYVDQRDVISLILTGCTVDLLTASSASQPTLETILGPLIGRLEREIQDVVKVEEFTIVPGVERTQVRISDSLTRRLSWKLQLDTQYNDASGQYAQLEYKLTDRLALQLSEGSQTNQNQSTNSNTRLTIDLKLKYRLTLD